MGSYKRDGQGRRARNRDDGLSGIKIKIPLFQGNYKEMKSCHDWSKYGGR